MSARHRHAKERQRELALLGTSAADALGPNLAIGSALCAAFARGVENHPAWKSWEPGCNIVGECKRDIPAIAIGDTVRVVWADSPWYSATGRVTAYIEAMQEPWSVAMDTKLLPVPVVMFRSQDLKRI